MEKRRKKWVLCNHCSKAYDANNDASGLGKGPEERGFCPFCGTTVLWDAIPWGMIRKNHPEYPTTPKSGQSFDDWNS